MRAELEKETVKAQAEVGVTARPIFDTELYCSAWREGA
jgi:hypothetical protein